MFRRSLTVLAGIDAILETIEYDSFRSGVNRVNQV
jgi:hypothetical protein